MNLKLMVGTEKQYSKCGLKIQLLRGVIWQIFYLPFFGDFEENGKEVNKSPKSIIYSKYNVLKLMIISIYFILKTNKFVIIGGKMIMFRNK